MTDAFETLSLPPRLDLGDEELRGAFREAGKRLHPDAGGGEGEFAALKEALAILSSPSRRLAHWLSLRGTAVEPRGMIAPGLMDLFGKIGPVSQMAETVIRKRETAQSALGKALLEPELQNCLQRVEEMIAEVDASLAAECAVFAPWMATNPDSATGSEKVRNLAFLEKWKTSLKSLYARML
ncbi:J domain-containing protein [Luteolibacter sp. SL250]|uniref:J domain-containing protein n=1 Tax=Luteolibacter sp. SL250 TaxID=2995170 RepID=UPI00226DC8E6|nr:J domain-containing protein [Luteolibacter sp. SL250]WAC18060.1 J domain-containing protein [Luteolibacter sp. SL250]